MPTLPCRALAPDEATRRRAAAAAGRGGGDVSRLQGLRVEPGTHTLRLRAGGRTQEKPITVRDDPRIDLAPADRRAWREAQRTAGQLWSRAGALAAKLLESSAASAGNRRLAIEVRDRLRGLYGDLDDYTGRPTSRSDERARVLPERG